MKLFACQNASDEGNDVANADKQWTAEKRNGAPNSNIQNADKTHMENKKNGEAYKRDDGSKGI